MKARRVNIDATVLFADLRGYTGLSQSQSGEAVSAVLDAFYDECAESIWEYDGLLNKTMGDAVMAIFNFPIQQEDHPARAVLTARKIQERWSARRKTLNGDGFEGLDKIAIGIGIDSGEVNFGEFGGTHLDLTAIGAVVNMASRAQSAASPDEILVTDAVHDRASAELGASSPQEYALKGFTAPVRLWAA